MAPVAITRLVVELSLHGKGAPESSGVALAGLFDAWAGDWLPEGTRFVPLVRSVTEAQLDRLRRRAADLAMRYGEPFDPADWTFGGFVAADFRGEAAQAIGPLVDALRAERGTLEAIGHGVGLSAFWIESYGEQESWSVDGGHARSAREVVDPDGRLNADLDGGHPEVALAVIEKSWELSHRDLETQAIRLLSPPTPPYDSDHAAHGLATLGLLVGPGGLIRGVRDLALLSPSDRCASVELNWTDAVLRALVELKPGDVLLLEQQKSLTLKPGYRRNYPPEVFPSVARAIGFASRCGVPVVEPAGNSGAYNAVVDFDCPRLADLLKQHHYTHPIGDLSRAILVTAASPAKGCPDFAANHGRCVAIRAPGSCILTTGWWQRTLVDPQGFTEHYGLTSAASALVAGALVVAQAARLNKKKRPLMARDFTNLLRNTVAGRDGLGVGRQWPLGELVQAALDLR